MALDLSNATAIQAALNDAYRRVGERMGTPHQVMRPASATAPLANVVATLPAAFSAEDYRFGKARRYGEATWFGWFDGARTQPGDYLQGTDHKSVVRTFFIAAQQPQLPILCVECDRAVRLTRADSFGGTGAGTGSAVGAAPYGGVESAPESVLGADTGLWPAAVFFGGRSDSAQRDTPTSVRQQGWTVLLPKSVPVPIGHGDTITDDLGRRYMVEGAELSDLGWRLQTHELHA